ncbi:hypothetical protein EG338_09175 [Kaistella haifensis]|nr:hypothetical protein EG338_09175 [Kaistella haifensis]
MWFTKNTEVVSYESFNFAKCSHKKWCKIKKIFDNCNIFRTLNQISSTLDFSNKALFFTFAI